jgi:hypothetical protein
MLLGNHPAQRFLPFDFCLLPFDFLSFAACRTVPDQTPLLSPPNQTIRPGMPCKGPELGEPKKSAFRVN